MINKFPNQTLSISLILIITVVYFLVKYNKNELGIISFIIYGLALILSQLFINLNLTNTLCGASQWLTTIFVTFIPWILIFGCLNLIIFKFPGWLKPFSNTFGYAAATAMGLNKVLNNIINTNIHTNNTNDNDSNEFAKIINDSKNRGLLINEIPPTSEGFRNFIEELKESKVLNAELLNISIEQLLNNSDVEKLQKYVRFKNIVAEFIWYSLTGVLTTLVSYNYIVNSTCSLSAAQIDINSNVK